MRNKNPILDDDIYDCEQPYKPVLGQIEDESFELENLGDIENVKLPREWNKLLEDFEGNLGDEEDERFEPMHFLSSKLEQLYSHPPEISLAGKNGRVSRILSRSFLNRIEILRDAIDEIKKEINKRNKLSKVLKEKIEAEIFNFECLLNKLDHWQLSWNCGKW